MVVISNFNRFDLLRCFHVDESVLSLLQYKPPLEVNDLFEDIKDGVKLLALLEVLSGQRLVSSTCGFVFCTKCGFSKGEESPFIICTRNNEYVNQGMPLHLVLLCVDSLM